MIITTLRRLFSKLRHVALRDKSERIRVFCPACNRLLAWIDYFPRTKEFALRVEADAVLDETAESWEQDQVLFCYCSNCQENRRLLVQPYVFGQPQPDELEYSKN
jgi:hypothetical protein